jgi:hypothetical protein
MVTTILKVSTQFNLSQTENGLSGGRGAQRYPAVGVTEIIIPKLQCCIGQLDPCCMQDTK